MSQTQSQSSNIFYEPSIKFEESRGGVEMDTETYETSFSRLKDSLCTSRIISNKYFITVLQECRTCIEQCLDAVTGALEETNVISHKLCGDIEKMVVLMQLLSTFIKKSLETIPFVCCNMKEFPIITGHIIFSVFNHCKNSECIYGAYLCKTEKHLKDLFRVCHELQLTYLMTMEKHFTFDLNEAEELDILLEALDINLKIGIVVQSLDIKTMAEQWKGHAALCDKYSKHLSDKNIFSKCIKLLSEMIMSNMNIVLEMQLESGMEKVVLRPIKVSSFGIKILMKMCTIFKSTSEDYQDVIDLLIYLYMHNSAYLELFMKKPLKVISLIEENIMVALESLLVVLIKNTNFLSCTCDLKVNKFKDEEYLGYIVLLTAIMKSILWNDIQVSGEIKLKIIKRVFYLLPSGHMWFNVKLKFKIDSGNVYKFYGLFEYILTVSLAFIRTFNSEQYSIVERILYSSLLETDFYTAIFACNLWLLLLRSNDPKLILNTTLSLLNVYKKLVKLPLFNTSPQKVYLTYTIRNLFKQCSKQEKADVFTSHNVEDTIDVWLGLKLTKLATLTNEQNIVRILNKMFKCLIEEDRSENLLGVTSLSHNRDKEQIFKLLVIAWSKARPCECYNDSFGKYEYIERLSTYTDSILNIIPKDVATKICNIIADILKTGNTEVVCLLFRKFCYFHNNFEMHESENFMKDVLIALQKTNNLIQEYVIITLNRNISDKMNKYIQSNYSLQDVLSSYSFESDSTATINLKTQLKSVEKDCFSHKCVTLEVQKQKTTKEQSNFDLNIDSLIDNVDEPCLKKPKFNSNENDDLVLKFEENVSRLCDVNNALSGEQKNRILNACLKLKNIVE